MNDFATVEKFDTHIHSTQTPRIIHQSAADNFVSWTSSTTGLSVCRWKDQEDIAQKQIKAFPGRVAYATTFSVKNWNSDRWSKRRSAI